ncbi:hypothetical protein KIPB_013440, partial [Kipferlia bialata]|eukprot:g13440.t1
METGKRVIENTYRMGPEEDEKLECRILAPHVKNAIEKQFSQWTYECEQAKVK